MGLEGGAVINPIKRRGVDVPVEELPEPKPENPCLGKPEHRKLCKMRRQESCRMVSVFRYCSKTVYI